MVFGFLRKKKELEVPPLPKEVTTETTTVDNVKAKMELVLAQVDSLRTQYEAMNERILSIERMVKELYAMAKS